MMSGAEEIVTLTASQMAAAMKKGDLSSRQIVEAELETAKAVDPKTQSYLATCTDKQFRVGHIVGSQMFVYGLVCNFTGRQLAVFHLFCNSLHSICYLPFGRIAQSKSQTHASVARGVFYTFVQTVQNLLRQS